jgi:hypothetical protein
MRFFVLLLSLLLIGCSETRPPYWDAPVGSYTQGFGRAGYAAK